MKKLFLLLFTTLFMICGLIAQVPQMFKYQAVLRDANGNVLPNAQKTVEVSILQTSASGTVVFTESHIVTTSALGLINLNIGSIEDLSVIDWSSDIYFVQITVDGVVMGASQILSVPYALNAKNAETADYNNLTNLPNLFDGNYNHLSNLPTLFSGNFADLLNRPTTIAGYGITDAFDGNYNHLSNLPTLFDGKWSSLTGTAPNISIFNNNSGYITNAWTGSTSLTTLGTITTGTWNGSAISASYIGNLPASQITTGTFTNSLINWAAPNAIGTTTPSSGAFTSLSANNGFTVSNGNIIIKPSGSGGANGYVLTSDGSGNSTWQPVPSSSGMNVVTQNNNYSILTTDGMVLTSGGYTFTLPSASAAGTGKIIYLYSTASAIILNPYSGNTIWDQAGNSHTTSFNVYNGVFVSDGVNSWYQIAN